MNRILFVLKKGGLKQDVYKRLMDIFRIENIKVISSHIIHLNDKEKFCKNFYPEQYAKYKDEIDKCFDKRVMAIIVDIGDRFKVHLRIKKYMRLTYGFNIIHCSDDSNMAEKEIDIVLNNKNKALFFDDQKDRRYEHVLIKKMKDKPIPTVEEQCNYVYESYKKIYNNDNNNGNYNFRIKGIKYKI